YSECEKILKNCLTKYKGAIFNTAGDSALAEFPSAVNAVECGVAFQNDIKKRNESDKTDAKLEFRIGINMGDVVKKEGNLFGDGVNIAARLEALAQPNGISISKSVYDLVVPKTKMTFNDLGVQKVKQNEFHAFDILLDPSQKRTLKTKTKSNLAVVGTIVAAIIISLFGAFYFAFNSETDSRKLRASSKPVILVMPIKSSGLSENQKGFANGVTESMIATLSGYQAIKVLSSSTSFHAEKTNMINATIKDEFGVNYIIRGSMQVMGNNARLNLEITDLDASKVSVSKKKDFKLDDIFEVQDELSNEILTTLQINLGVGSVQGSNWTKDYNSMKDFNLFLNWRQEWRKFTKSGYINSLRMFEELKSSYPDEKRAILVQEAWQLYQKILLGLSKSKEEDMERLNYSLNRAIEIDPVARDAFAARSIIGLRMLNGNCEEALGDIAQAEEIGSTVDTLTIAGTVYELCGDIKKGIEAKRNALLLIPNDTGWFITNSLVFSLYKDNQIDEIYKLLGDDIDAEDMRPTALALYAFLEYEKGNLKRAKQYYERAKKNNFDKKKFERQFRQFREFNYHQKELLEKTLKGLSKIGDLK
ncbi:adenylate/guanylate cyclase domain-containing protein, partial [Paracoccaceae bacterium]|nr:adenylate/guanylate cyclase domain-containing protein [Paracoccaceae bacterium]